MVSSIKKSLPALIFFVFCLLSFIRPSATEGALLPVADREAAEKYFEEAYEKYRVRDYFGALENLDRALKLNTYLVDYYLMKGLALRRLGREEEALQALLYFLEVRPGDKAAPKIISRLREEGLFLKSALSGRPIFSRTSFSQKDLRSTLNLPLAQNLAIKGLGKVGTSPGGGMAVADTLGDKLWLRFPGEKSFFAIDTPSPGAFIFTGDRKGILLSETGEVFAFSEMISEPQILGKLPFSPSSGAMAEEGAFIAASPFQRRVVLLSLPELEPLKEFTFPKGDHLFEPSAVAVWGEWLAVADRNNGRIYVLPLAGTEPAFFFDSESPRDLIWSPLGDLFVVCDSGEISKWTLSFENLEAVHEEVITPKALGAWSLFSLEDKVYCVDISGYSLWEMYSLPDEPMPAFISIDSPEINREAERESFLIKAAVAGPFQTYKGKNQIIINAVWNERILTAVYRPSSTSGQGRSLYLLTPGKTTGRQHYESNSGKEALHNLAALWFERRDSLEDLVVSASIPFSREEVAQLVFFCLNNGIRLFVYCDGHPSTALARASGLTGGLPLFNLIDNPPDFSFPSRGEIYIPLPSEETSSGFPSRSILSIYLDAGFTSSRDWMPLWPDLL